MGYHVLTCPICGKKNKVDKRVKTCGNPTCSAEYRSRNMKERSASTRAAPVVVDPTTRDRVVDELKRSNDSLLRQLADSKASKAELIAAVDQAAREAASALALAPVKAPAQDKRDHTPEVAIAVLSDLQLGKLTPTYSSDICEARIEEYGRKVIKLANIQRADHPVKELRVYLLGDIVEGELIFPGQHWRIDSSLYRQVVVNGPRILGNFLRSMLAAFEKVKVVGCIGNHGCCSDDTEALTKSGWKLRSDIAADEPIRVFDPETHEVRWEIPSEWHDYRYDGDMVHVVSTRVDQLVTPNHDLWVTTDYATPFRKVQAGTVCGTTIHAVGGFARGEAAPIVIPEHVSTKGRIVPGLILEPTHGLASFLGWYVSEGGVDKKLNRISLSQDTKLHPEHAKSIEVACGSIGVSGAWSQKNYRISNTSLAKWLASEFGRTSHDKHLPAWLKAWPVDLLEEFMMALRAGDGTARGEYAWTLTTTSNSLIDDVQEVCSVIGWGSSAKERYHGKCWGYNGSARKLHIHMRQFAKVPAPARVAYSGNVWCPTVSTGLFLVRRNGKVSVTGNSVGGRARQDYHPETNADLFVYGITQQLLANEPRLEWEQTRESIERQWYAIDTIGDKRCFLFHGDQIKGGFAGFPWYGFGKKLTGWRTLADMIGAGTIDGTFDYAFSGHFHTPVRTYLNGITHWGNGTTESSNTYAAEELASAGEPCQWLLFAHPHRGVTAEYLVRLGEDE